MADFTLKYSGEKINELLDKAGTALQEHQDISGKQENLVSGENIKTFNGQSLLGPGNIEVISSIPDYESPEGTEGYIRNKTHYAEVISELPPFKITNGGTILLSGVTPFSTIEFRNNLVNKDICLSIAQSGTTVSLPTNGPDVEAIWSEEEDGNLSLVQTTESNYGVLNIINPFVVNFKHLPDAYISGDIARSSEVNDVRSKVDNVLGEDGYVYSNGEKVDMRFTRSLLPVGTSIPAKANLNSKTYLKIGKYYCSLNVDAKTITNCPTSEAFSMEVFNPLGTNVDDEDTREYTYRLRVLTAYKTGVHYVQYCATSGTAGSWTYNGWFVVPRTSFSLASSKNGGSAAKGASNRGVYIDSTGTFQQMGYTVAKSVPSNAVFTDTNTKVTSVENHYTPAEDIEEQLNATEGEVVVGIKRDAAGHVVGIRTTSPYKRLIDERPLDTTAVVFQQSELGDSFYSIKAIEVAGYNKLTIDLPEFDYTTASTKSFSTYWEDEEIYVVIILAGGDAPLIRVNLDRVVDSATISAIEYIPISESYIPASIARVADVGNAIASAITNVLNTPV